MSITISQPELTVNAVHLSTSLVTSEKAGACLLIITGGANIPLKSSSYLKWQELIATHSVSSLTFDFRGVGENGVSLSETNLSTRLEDAEAALAVLRSQAGTPMFVMGVSMGAPIAIELALKNNLKGLIIVSPAAYLQNARTQNFGEAFSKAIRGLKSWQASPDFAHLKEYKGKILYAYGDHDEVIPSEILSEYRKITTASRGQALKLACTHSFMRGEDAVSIEARRIFTETALEFLQAEVDSSISSG